MHATSQVNIKTIIFKFVDKMPGKSYAKKHLNAEHLVKTSLYLKEFFTKVFNVKFSKMKDFVIATHIKNQWIGV